MLRDRKSVERFMAAEKKGKSKGKKLCISWMGWVLLILACVVPAGLVGTFLCVYMPPGKLGLSSLLGLAFPWLVLLSAALGIIYLFFFKKRCLVFFAAILLNFQNLGLLVRLPHRENSHDETPVPTHTTTRESEFKILSYNVCLFGFYAKQDDRNELKNHIATFLDMEEADILCLQEYYESKDQRFRIQESLQKAGYRYHTNIRSNKRFYFGNVIFSRYPILKQDTLPGLAPLYAMYADLLLPDKDTLRVYTFHLSSLRFDEHDKSFYNDLMNNSVDESVSYKAEAGKIAHKVGAAARIHAEQVRSLKTHADACPYRLVMCGDMNENPISYAYHLLSRGMQDAFVERGSGLGRTYNGLFPAYRIDYIFYRSALNRATGKVVEDEAAQMEAQRFEVLDMTYSDHKPISAVIRY